MHDFVSAETIHHASRFRLPIPLGRSLAAKRCREARSGMGWLAATALLAEEEPCRPGSPDRRRGATGFESAAAAFSGEPGG